MKLHRIRFMLALMGLSVVLAARPAAAEVVEVNDFINTLPVGHCEHFNDFSWLRVIDVDEDGLFSVGDVFEGAFNVESLGLHGGDVGYNRMSVGGDGDPVEVTGYYKAVVGEITSEWMYLAPEADFEATYGTGAMVAVYEDAANNFSADLPLKLLDVIDLATDGTHLMTMGFAGQGGEAESGEGWKAMEWVTVAPGESEIDEASNWSAGAWGVYQANLNIISSPGLDNAMDALDITHAQPSQFSPGTSTQISFNGQLWGQAENGAFPLSDSADMFFTVVPEPAGVAILAQLLCLAAGGWAFRRR